MSLLIALAAVAVALSGGKGGTAHRPPAATVAPAGPRSTPRSPQIVRGPHDAPVPILMYHVVSAPMPGALNVGLYTPKPVFAAQMHALAQRGYHGVTLARVYDYWKRGYALPSRPIVVSFDDGYLSDYTHALPVLRGLGWPGVLNLEVNNIRPGDITAPEVRALLHAGWEVDSHTVDHPDLTTLAPPQLRDELVRSRADIERRFHVPAEFFCYPSGRFDARVVAAVKAAGYRAATTTEPGLATPRSLFTLSRIRVSAQDGIAGLESKLAHPGTVAAGSPIGG